MNESLLPDYDILFEFRDVENIINISAPKRPENEYFERKNKRNFVEKIEGKGCFREGGILYEIEGKLKKIKSKEEFNELLRSLEQELGFRYNEKQRSDLVFEIIEGGKLDKYKKSILKQNIQELKEALWYHNFDMKEALWIPYENDFNNLIEGIILRVDAEISTATSVN